MGSERLSREGKGVPTDCGGKAHTEGKIRWLCEAVHEGQRDSRADKL